MNFLGPLCAFLAALTWAYGSNVYSELAKQYKPYIINFNRALLSIPCFFLTIISTNPEGWINDLKAATATHYAWLSLSMISSYVLGDLLFLWSTTIIGAPAALAVASAYPIWSALVGWIFKGQVLSILQIFGLCMVVVGISVVVRSPAPHETAVHDKKKWAYLACLATSFLWAINTVAVTEGGSGLEVGVVGFIRMCIALMLCPIVGNFLLNQKGSLKMKPSTYKSYWWLFLIEGFGGSFVYVYGFQHSPLAVGSALSSMAPVLSVPIALILGTERVSASKTIGITIATLGAILLVVSRA